MNSLTKLFTVGLLIGVFAAPGCGNFGGKRYDPAYWHENFVNILSGQVGNNFGGLRYSGWDSPGRLANKTILPNGHVEYTYDERMDKYPHNCQYTFEVDPKTNIVVAARWMGDRCIIVP